MHANDMSKPDVTDTNIERLLTTAYQPEEPDPAFVQRVGRLLQATAAERAHGHAATPPHVLRLRRRLAWVMTAAASVAALALVQYARRPRPVEHRVVEQVASAQPDHTAAPDSLGLTARPRTPAPAATPLAVGSEVRTGAGERRRVTLPDGSVLYVNQSTTMKLETERRVALTAGEVFVEVARNDKQDRFVVRTGGREVVALGTKFAVRADAPEPRVFVTQGRVEIAEPAPDGFAWTKRTVEAGEQLVMVTGLATGTRAPAPRATHLLDWTRDLMAAAESPLVPASKHQGGALLAVDPNGQEAKLSLRKYHIDVHIEDGFARTTIDQTYFNHESFRLEGTFYFPLPPDASLSHLAMYVDGVLMQGGMCEREHARQVFETILHTQRDPALLEWVDGSTFKMRVFPLEGRQEKRILLSYTQRLDTLYGRTHYRFPAGHNLDAVGAWSFHARIRRGGDVDWKCDSHKLAATQKDGDLILTAEQKHVKLDRDITLTLHDAPAPGAVRFSSADHDGSRYLMVRYRPKLTAPVAKQRRDWVFLFESAGSRDPLLARVQIDVIRTILNNAEHDDTFAVVTAGTRAQAFASGAVPATPENVRQAVQWLERTHLVGALDLGKALAATEPFVKAGKNPHLVHVGAGVASMGERREDVLAKAVPENARYVGVGVGKRWSRGFMKQAAERTGGFFTQINPDEPVAWRAFDLLATLNTPRLLDVKVLDDAEKVPFLSYTGLLADGEEVCAVARVGTTQDALPKAITITGRLGGKPYAETFPVRNVAPKADYLPRTWAKLEIDRLLAADAEANKAKLVELSKAMYVMTPFTSLLVLESDAMYTQFNVDRGRKDHWALYQSPEKIPVVYEPLAGPAPATASTPGKKPMPGEVLNTILVRVPPRVLHLPNRPDPYGGSHVLTALQLYQGAFAVPDLRFASVYDINGIGERWGSSMRIRNGQNVVQPQKFFDEPLQERESILGLQDRGLANDLGYLPRTSSFVQAIPPFGSRGGGFGRAHIPNQGWGSWEVAGSGGRGRNRLTLPFQPFGFINDFQGLGSFPSGGGFGGGLSGFGGGLGGFGGFGDRMSPFGGSFGSTSGSMFGPATFLQPINPMTEDLAEKALRVVPITGADPTLVQQAIEAVQLRKKVSVNGRFNPNLLWSEVELERLTKGDSLFLGGLEDGKKKGKNNGWLEWDALSLGKRLQLMQPRPSLLYERPQFTGDVRVFSDLVAYAPGMNTTTADIQAVLEAEAALPAISSGRIDPAAKALIEQARSAGWQSLSLGGGVTLSFDGAGRYAYERKLSVGLREQVYCDGTTLLHLYPELGVGARRAVSRFHRAWLTDLIPWLVPTVEDLARGADLAPAGERTVAVTPRGAAAAKDADGKPISYVEAHLVFAADGRLAERRVFVMPAKQLLYRETYGADGYVRILDAADKVVSEEKLILHPAEAPDLKPDVSKLVVLPLPLRPLEQVAKQFDEKVDGDFEKLSDDAALAVFAAHYGAGRGEVMLNLFGNRYHRNGDRRLGFYTLIAATKAAFFPGNEHWTGRHQVRLDPVREHPGDALAQYLARHNLYAIAGRGEFGELRGSADGFVQRLAGFHDLWHRWHAGKVGHTGVERWAHWDRACAYAKSCASPLFKWATLDLMQQHALNRVERGAELTAAYRDAGTLPELRHLAHVELARNLMSVGDWNGAMKVFEECFTNALKRGLPPPIDAAFYQALQQHDLGRAVWQGLLRKAGDRLREEKRPGDVLALAWQCHQLGDANAARELLGGIFTGLADALRPAVTLAVVEFHLHMGDHARADVLLQGLLEDKRFQESAGLWRLAAQVAFQRGMTARGVRYQEKALDLEFRDLPAVINLQAVRQEYGQLLAHYQQLAAAVTMLEAEPPKEFLARVIRAADRWRALDPDPTAACQAAARVLQQLGAKELAWDYLTTPVGLRPNEAAPWVSLAQQLHGDGAFDLASQAYTTAYEAEPTNAQILWDHAQMLQQIGRMEQVGPLYQKLAEGDWQPRFQGLRNQARQLLNWR